MKCQRDNFDIPQEVTYLNCAFMSPLSKKLVEIGAESVKAKMQPWKVKTDDFFALVEETKNTYAKLLNTEAKNIALLPSVSYGLALAEKNIDPKIGNSVLVLEDQFPSNFYIWQNWCQQNNKKLITVPKVKNKSLTESILEHLNPDVAVAALPQVHWCDGALVDLITIGKACREMNVKLVVDGTQSVGAMPFSIPEIQPDFLIVANYKWMMGPYSMAFAYISPEFHKGKPLEFGWLNKKGCENFKNLVDYQDEFMEGAVRFDVGQKCNFALLPMAISATKTIIEMEPQNIANYSKSLNDHLIKQCSNLDLNLWDEKLRAPHMLGIEIKSEKVIEKLSKNLIDNNIYTSFRGNTLRVSPNVYNNTSDMDKLAQVLLDNLQ